MEKMNRFGKFVTSDVDIIKRLILACAEIDTVRNIKVIRDDQIRFDFDEKSFALYLAGFVSEIDGGAEMTNTPGTIRLQALLAA